MTEIRLIFTIIDRLNDRQKSIRNQCFTMIILELINFCELIQISKLMGICLSSQNTEFTEITANSQHWRTVEDFFKKYGKIKQGQANLWCQHHINPDADWVEYFQFPIRSNQFVFRITKSIYSFVNIFIFRHEHKQKWKRIKYISIHHENNKEIISMIAYRQFWYLQNLIFNDEEDRAKLYYKCIFSFDLTSGLIDKIEFINLYKVKDKQIFDDNDIKVDLSQARPELQKKFQQEEKKKNIQVNRKKQQQRINLSSNNNSQKERRNYYSNENMRKQDNKIDNERREREADHRKAQERRDQQRRQWQYERKQQSYKNKY